MNRTYTAEVWAFSSTLLPPVWANSGIRKVKSGPNAQQGKDANRTPPNRVSQPCNVGLITQVKHHPSQWDKTGGAGIPPATHHVRGPGGQYPRIELRPSLTVGAPPWRT